jgi:hypothetical protein
LIDARYLVLAVLIEYYYRSGGKAMMSPNYRISRSILDAIYASNRLVLPLDGVLLWVTDQAQRRRRTNPLLELAADCEKDSESSSFADCAAKGGYPARREPGRVWGSRESPTYGRSAISRARLIETAT